MTVLTGGRVKGVGVRFHDWSISNDDYGSYTTQRSSSFFKTEKSWSVPVIVGVVLAGVLVVMIVAVAICLFGEWIY